MRKTYIFLLTALMSLLGFFTASAQRALVINSITVENQYTPLIANSENKVTGLVYTLELKNTGYGDLNPGDEGFEIELYQTSKNVTLATLPITEAIAEDETKTISFTWNFSLDPLEAEYPDYKGWINSCLGVKEHVSGTKKTPGWRDIYPYTSFFKVTTASNNAVEEGTAPTSGDYTIDFGFCASAFTKSFFLRNYGGKPLEVASISLPEGFTATDGEGNELVFPIALPSLPDRTDPSLWTPFKVTFDHNGSVSGDMVITCADGFSRSYPVKAAAPGEGVWCETFEGGNAPGWILGEKSSVAGHYTYAPKVEGNELCLYATQNGGTYADPFANPSHNITPRLAFNEGDQLFFQAEIQTTSYPAITVKWSPDRTNWTVLKKIAVPGRGGDEDFDTGYMNYKGFFVDMPEGEGYVGFDMNMCRIDNVMGGSLVEVDLDAYFKSSSIQSGAMVNNPLAAKAAFANLGRDIQASEYTVKLMAAPVTVTQDEEENEERTVGDAVAVYTFPSVDIPQGETAEFEGNYIPHQEGDFEMWIQVAFPAESFATTKQNVTVTKEVFSADLTLGERTKWDNTAPLYMYYKSSKGQVMYTADMCAQYGLKKGDVINGVKMYGYSASNKEITSPVGISFGMKNSIAGDLTAAETFTEYQGHQGTYDVHASGADTAYPVIDITFSKPFTYEGDDLVIEICSEDQNTYQQVYFEAMNYPSGKTLYRTKKNDNYSSYQSAVLNNYTGSMPVFHFSLAAEPAEIEGTVTWEDEPVAGATVLLDNEGVEYRTVTDEEGKYKMEVIQAGREYRLQVMAEGHPRYTHTETVVFGGEEGNPTVDVNLRDWPTLSGTVKDADDQGVSAQIQLAYGEYSTVIISDDEGNFSKKMDYIDALPFTVTVDHPDFCVYTGEVDLYDGLDKTLDIVMTGFDENRAFAVNVQIEDVRGTDLEGTVFTLHHTPKDITYASEETTLDAEGNCTINVFGGLHHFTLTADGMKPFDFDFNVNKDMTLALTWNEEVRQILDVTAELQHDAFTGQDNIYVSWDAEQPQRAASRVPQRTAANPAEKFVVELDGNKVGETEEYFFLIENVDGGAHSVNVYSQYSVQSSQPVEVELSVPENNNVQATYNVTTNNAASADGAVVKVVGEGQEISLSVADGKAVIPYLAKGTYEVSVTQPYFLPWSKSVTYTGKQAVAIELQEAIAAPVNVEAVAEENLEDETFTVSLKWNKDAGFADSFEDYDDFATEFGAWNTINGNTEVSYPISLGSSIVTFPGCSTPDNGVSVAPMVFNAAATTPSMENDPAIAAASGAKSILFQAPQNAVADKWLISPAIDVKADYEWTLKAKAYTSYPEAFELLVSTDGNATEDFQVLETIKPSFDKWADYAVDLAAYEGQQIYLAIHCVSEDGFIALVDDFAVGLKGEDKTITIGHVTSYDVHLNDAVVGNTQATEHTLTGVAAGQHTVGVKANYASGASEVTTVPLMLISGLDSLEGSSLKGDVVNASGLVIMRDATMKDVKKLDKGIYIFRGRKVVVK